MADLRHHCQLNTPQSRSLDNSFRFGRTVHKYIRASLASLPRPYGSSFPFHVAIIYLKVTFLLLLDLFRKYRIMIDSGTGHVSDNDGIWKDAFHYARDHALMVPKRQSSIYSIKEKGEKLHIHFYQQSPGKFFKLITRVNSEEKPRTVLDTLKRIGDACIRCQELPVQSFLFLFAIREDEFLLNSDIDMDIIWVGKRPMLHVVETQTGYENASFVLETSARRVFNSIRL